MQNPKLVAQELLSRDEDAIEELRVHQFNDDDASHDDRFHQELNKQFTDAFDQVVLALVSEFGLPTDHHDDSIPLSGVLRAAVWRTERKSLFLAAAHEDSDCPYLLVLGTYD